MLHSVVFTRGLPPCGSSAAEAAGFVSHPGARCPVLSGRAEAPGYALAPWCAPLPSASPALSQRSLPAGCRPAAQARRRPPVVRSHLGAHPCHPRREHLASVLYPRAAALRLIRLPPCGSACFPPRSPSCLCTPHDAHPASIKTTIISALAGFPSAF
jgi:hypothetical protein